MNKCTHTWVGTDFGEIYCSKCKKSRYATELETTSEVVETPAKPATLTDIYKPKAKAK